MWATVLLIPLLLQGTTGAATARGERPTGAVVQRASPEEELWREIVGLRDTPTASQPWNERFAEELRARRTLLERVGLYLTLYPGGTHRDEAVRLELATLFEIAMLSGSNLELLAARARQYERDAPSAAVRAEAAYWALVCARAATTTAATQPTSAPVTAADDALLESYRRYVERFPTSAYVPRMTVLLFEDALQRGDLAAGGALVERLRSAFPDHAVTASLIAQLARSAAVGRPFWLAARPEGQTAIDTRQFVGQPVLIVVWAGFDAESRRRVSAIEAFRRAHPHFRVVGVNLDESVEAMAAACAPLGIDWPQFNDGRGWANEFALTWGVRRIPWVFVIDRAGRLVESTPDERWREWAERQVTGR